MSLAQIITCNSLRAGYSPERVLWARGARQLGGNSGAMVGSHRVPGGRRGSILAGQRATDRTAAGLHRLAATITRNQALSAPRAATVATAPSQRGAGSAECRPFRACRRLIDNLQTLPLLARGSASARRSLACAGGGCATPSRLARGSYIPSRTPWLETGKTRPDVRPHPVGITGTWASKGDEARGKRPEIHQDQLGSGVRVARGKELPGQSRAVRGNLRFMVRDHLALDLGRVEHQAKVSA